MDENKPGLTDIPNTESGEPIYDIESHIKSCLDFVRKYNQLIISNCPEFIILDTWNNDDVIATTWRKWWDEILANGENWDEILQRVLNGKDLTELPLEIVNFRKEIDRLSLSKTTSPLIDKLQQKYAIAHPFKLGLKLKKTFEIDALAALITSICRDKGIEHIIDVGAGQGFLSRVLKRQFGFHVLAIDFDKEKTFGARRMDDVAYTKYPIQNEHGSLIHKTLLVTPESVDKTMQKVWGANLPPSLLCGLHACGDLTPTIMNVFENISSIKVMVCIGCCYNLISVPGARNIYWNQPGSSTPFDISPKLTSFGFPLSKVVSDYSKATDHKLSRHARMLGVQSTKKWLAEWPQTKESIRRSFWRSLLESLLQNSPSLKHLTPKRKKVPNDEHDEWEPSIRIGRLPNAAFTDFLTYVKLAIAKVSSQTQFDNKSSNLEQLIFQEIDDFYRETTVNQIEAKFFLWWSLRGLIGNVVETLIALDRYLFLSQMGCVDNTKLLCGVDEVRSPRNLILVSTKKS